MFESIVGWVLKRAAVKVPLEAVAIGARTVVVAR